MKNKLILGFNLGFVVWIGFLNTFEAGASVTCKATCAVYGKQFYFSFNRINSDSYRAGMERCMRIPARAEVIPVSQGSSTEMACYNYIQSEVAVQSTDASEWLAQNELTKQCEDKYKKGDSRGYDWTRGSLKNSKCSKN